jgi:hypothetical protein
MSGYDRKGARIKSTTTGMGPSPLPGHALSGRLWCLCCADCPRQLLVRLEWR